jgi:hypothetical protein
VATVRRYSGGGEHSTAPGVFILKVDPIPRAGITSGVPLFIGFVPAPRDPELVEASGEPKVEPGQAPPPVRVTVENWEDFQRKIGPGIRGGFLDYAVRGFFQNEGARCVVLALPVPDSARSTEVLAGTLRELFHAESYGADYVGVRGVLDEIDDVDLVCVPDIVIEEIRQVPPIVYELQNAVLRYCEDRRERLAILDSLSGDAGSLDGMTEAAIEQWRELTPGEYGALYFPWVKVKSLDGAGERWVPPCGHVAGIYARSDARVGFHKAPANEVVEGALDVQAAITPEAQGRLNEVGVNCLRNFPRRGLRVWGARTLSGHRHWRYVNVRRVFLILRRWIEHNMNDLAFEPNNPALWDLVLDRLRGFCYELYVRGALTGTSPEEAFFLKCDGELNPPAVRDEGRVVCEIGLAPAVPAEFIVIRVTRVAAGTFTAAPAGG